MRFQNHENRSFRGPDWRQSRSPGEPCATQCLTPGEWRNSGRKQVSELSDQNPELTQCLGNHICAWKWEKFRGKLCLYLPDFGVRRNADSDDLLHRHRKQLPWYESKETSNSMTAKARVSHWAHLRTFFFYLKLIRNFCTVSLCLSSASCDGRLSPSHDTILQTIKCILPYSTTVLT